LLVIAGGTVVAAVAGLPKVRAAERKEQSDKMEVLAVEDLMREHGVLRRALLVYSEAAARLAHGQSDVPLEALGRTASLFRTFGEDYHERSLEEKYVFVPLMGAGGQKASIARTLTDQHERGRQITDYVAAVAKKSKLAASDATALSSTLTAFVRMYEHHAAIEDTVIFPAWKDAISPAEYHELSEQFEELEHEMFGEDGFDDAVEKIAAIEQAFGLSNLSALTAPAPPKAG